MIIYPPLQDAPSRRSSLLTSTFVQPDIAAPGVNILAAYTKLATVTGEEGDTRVVKYNIQSGTSMACPHVSGAAAYVKSFHPNWSPAAIKSAARNITAPACHEQEGRMASTILLCTSLDHYCGLTPSVMLEALFFYPPTHFSTLLISNLCCNPCIIQSSA